MTLEEKFIFDLEGYFVIENVLTVDEVAELIQIIDKNNKQADSDAGRPSSWGDSFKRMIDHPRIFPYLVELLGPYVRLDHDYAIFMDQSDSRGGLHGGPDVVGDHWY